MRFLPLPLSLLLLGCLFASAQASQVCLMDGRGARPADAVDCPSTTQPCGSAQAITSPWLAVALDAGYASTPVDVFGRCRYLDSVSEQEFFVPFATETEWTAFLAGLPASVAATPCARPFSGIDATKHLYLGPTSAQANLGDTGDAAYAPVSLPYAREGSIWPPAKTTCGGTTQVFNHSCYEDVPTYKCFRTVPQTCTQYKCNASSGGSCSSWTQVSVDCSYCAEPGSTCEKKWHSWSETFDFVATALNSDTENPSWQGQSKRTAGTTRPVECNIRGTQTARDCTGTPTSCIPSGATNCVGGVLKDSCGRNIGKCCAPDGLTYCVNGRKLNSCGADQGPCCANPSTYCDSWGYAGGGKCARRNGCGEVVGTCYLMCNWTCCRYDRNDNARSYEICHWE